jgi:hypothetical protein
LDLSPDGTICTSAEKKQSSPFHPVSFTFPSAKEQKSRHTAAAKQRKKEKDMVIAGKQK